MPFDLGPGAALWLGFALFGAGFVRGYSGFGFSALVIAAAALVTNPLHLVAVVVLFEALLSLQAFRGIRADIDWRRVWLLMGGAAIGLPLGLWALTGVGEAAARGLISAYILIMCSVLMAGLHLHETRRPGANLAVGLISGAANAPGMGGLPVAAFFAAQGLRPAVFRATLVAYFPLLDLYSLPWFAGHGLIGWDTARALALGLPFALAGNWLGGRHFLAADPQEFRRFAILLLAGLAALGLMKSLF